MKQLVLFLGMASAVLLGHGIAAGATFTLHRWTTADGLPQNKVQCVGQTQDGYLWAGTVAGLARFDGVRFSVLGSSDPLIETEVMPAVSTIAEDKVDGSLWIATNAGLFRKDRNNQLTRFTPNEGLPHRKVWKLLSRSNGELWMETEVGIARLKQGVFRLWNATDGLPDTRFNVLTEGPNGRVWLADETWHCEFDPVAEKFIKITLPGLPQGTPIRSMAFSRTGELLIGTDAGLYRGQNGKWQLFDTKNGLGNPWIHFIFEDSRGELWVGTRESGLYRLEGNRFSRIELGISNSEFTVDRMCEDREGNLWLATPEGLLQLQRQSIRTLTVADGLVDDGILTAYADPNGGIWFGSGLGLNWVGPAGGIESYRHPFPRSQSNVRGLCLDGRGNLWAGALGLYRFQDKALKGVLPQEVGVQSIYRDHSGILWVGTMNGVVKDPEGERKWFTTRNGLGSNGAAVFLEDHTGNLWIGNGSGLHRMREGKIIRYSEPNGLRGAVKAIMEDPDGALWIGDDEGLLRFTEDRFFRFGSEHGLPEKTVHQILDDGVGFLWFSGLKGLHRVSLKELRAVAEGKQPRAHFITFDETDGMLTSETNGGIAPAGCRSPDGRLWFPTIKGVAVLDPKLINLNNTPPPVIIEEVKANSEVIFGDAKLARAGLGEAVAGSPLKLRPGSGRFLEFKYTANSFVAPKKVRFKYRMEPCDHDWVDAGDRRLASYNDLQPGSYRFRVKACNNQGVWNGAGDSFGFTVVAPPFTETVPFYIAVGLGLLALAIGWHRYRIKHHSRIQTLEHQLAFERERMRIAQDIHDDIGASLTHIQLLSEVIEGELGHQRISGDAKSHAQHIASTAREVAQRMDEIVWAVDPLHDTVASFIDYVCHFAQEILQPAEIRCRLDVANTLSDGKLASETRHELYHLLREGLNNIVKHSKATEATLRIHQRKNCLEIDLEDNGCGFVSEQPHPKGNGLTNMKCRANKLNGMFRVESGSKTGTKLHFEIPLS